MKRKKPRGDRAAFVPGIAYSLGMTIQRMK